MVTQKQIDNVRQMSLYQPMDGPAILKLELMLNSECDPAEAVNTDWSTLVVAPKKMIIRCQYCRSFGARYTKCKYCGGNVE